MKDVIGQPHFIFSVENAAHPPKVESPTHEEALEWLRRQGEDAISATGYYDRPERSIIVCNPKNIEGLKQLAQDTGQESVINSDGHKHELHFINGEHQGKVVHGIGSEVFPQMPQGPFTSYIDEHNDPIYFRHNFDLESMEKAEGLKKRKRDPGRKEPAMHGHHTIPVKESGLPGLEWHLRNLWETQESPGGWRSIKEIPREQHIKIHAGRRRKKLAASEELEKAQEPNDQIRQVADQYTKSKGLQIQHNLMPIKANPEKSIRIAQAYHEMPHTPNDPAVQSAYGHLINETMDQFQHIKNAGLKISKIQSGAENPYKTSKDLFHDIKNNNHMWFYPTESGFGTENKITDHPMLAPTNETHEGRPLLANDVFRIVHDYFGHAKEGHGFGPNGEENAWQNHMQMYSPEAQKAMTAETRGQNSWVNFGPHAIHNRANPSQTIYADQKAGLLPEWALSKSEDLNKGPLPSLGYDIERAKKESLPDIAHNDDYIHKKSVRLPNGLEYRKYQHKFALPHQEKFVHTLFDPSDKHEPLAYMETSHDEDDSGFHPHAVDWSEVQPLHRGKGLGRQLYLATLVHSTNKLTSDAHISPEAHRMWESLKSYPGLRAKIRPYKHKADPFYRPPMKDDKFSERHHVYVRDLNKLDHAKMFPPVDLFKLAASENEESELLKAIDEKSWNRILKTHNKSVREDVVDSGGHIRYFNNTHPEYQSQVLDSNKKMKSDSSRGMGSFPKMIHTLPSQEGEIKFMAKPYHAPMERWAKSWTKHPIKGWATLTTKKLFDAAQIPELAEDISAHVHKGVPIIVSRFHPEAKESYNTGPNKYTQPFTPPDVAKILVMDFLTNNQDRHSGNIMRINEHEPLAIDHERNFQYFHRKPGFDPNISPYHAWYNSGFAEHNKLLPNQIDTFSDHLVDWWGKARDNVKKEMYHNLKFIKDPSINRHIAGNFYERWRWINDRMESDPSLMFDKNVPGSYPLGYRKDK